MKKIKISLFTLILLFILSLFGCSKKEASSDVVYTTIYPIYSLTKLIAKDKLKVYKLVKDGAEIHSFEPTSKDIAKLANAKAIIYSGLVDEWVKKIAEGTDVEVFSASDGISFLNSDPHIWTSVRLLQKMATNIKDALCKIDSKNAKYYKENSDIVIKELKKLDKKFYDLSKKAKTKEFLILHPSFGYLARDYNLTQYSITGVNEEEEPSASKMKEIIKIIKSHNIKYILIDPNENLPIANTLVKDFNINPIFVYGMGIVDKNQSEDQTILSLMEKNYNAFEKALK